jgi:dihydropteroate synthase
MPAIPQSPADIDEALSQRSLDLDPAGYFIIYLDVEQRLICAKLFTTVIDERGVALDPDTGKPLPARSATGRTEARLFTGRTAKELCVNLFEGPDAVTPLMMDHAAYVGRESLRAEMALMQHSEYIQD